MITDYINNFIYENNQLKYIFVAEGRILVKEDGNLDRQYFMKDHLGNIRLTFDTDTNVLQEDSYYPFGMTQKWLNHLDESLLESETKNKFLFNGKEKDEFTGFIEYGFRDYDAQIARWHVRDPMAEMYSTQSPYHFASNNPINNIEINGAVYSSDREEWEGMSLPTPYYDGMGMSYNSEGGYSIRGGGMGEIGPSFYDLYEEDENGDWHRKGETGDDDGVRSGKLTKLWVKLLNKLFPKLMSKRLDKIEDKVTAKLIKLRLPNNTYEYLSAAKKILELRLGTKMYIYRGIVESKSTGWVKKFDYRVQTTVDFVDPISMNYNGIGSVSRIFHIGVGVINPKLNITFDPIGIPDRLKITGGVNYDNKISDPIDI